MKNVPNDIHIEKDMHEKIKEQCTGCEAWGGDDCTRNPITEGCLKDLNENNICLVGDTNIPEGMLKASNTNEPIIIKMNNNIENYEMVDHPKHYRPGTYEAINVIEARQGKEGCFNFCIGNSLKYIARLDKKESDSLSKENKTIEDLKKAIWYLEYAIKMKS